MSHDKTDYGATIYHNKRGVQYVKAEELAQNEHIQKLFKDAAEAFDKMNDRTEEKLWCAYCGEYGDHRSGKHFLKEPDWESKFEPGDKAVINNKCGALLAIGETVTLLEKAPIKNNLPKSWIVDGYYKHIPEYALDPITTRRYWVSWRSTYHVDDGCTKPPYDIWITGEGEKLTLCGVIDATSETEAWKQVEKHFPDYEERFIREQGPHWEPPRDRFPKQ